jgi:hypothetical protein
MNLRGQHRCLLVEVGQLGVDLAYRLFEKESGEDVVD